MSDELSGMEDVLPVARSLLEGRSLFSTMGAILVQQISKSVKVIYSRKIDVNEVVNKIQTFAKKAQEGETDSSEIEEILKDGLKDLTGQIELAVCKTNGTKLYEATLKTIDCAKNSKSDGIICDTMNAQFKTCIAPIEKIFEDCLEAKYQEIPKLIVDSITSTSEYLCDAKVRDIVELTNQCAASEPETLKNCVTDLEKVLKNIDTVSNLKTELCSQLTKQKQCLLSHVEKNCKNELTKRSFNNLFEAAIVKPCA